MLTYFMKFQYVFQMGGIYCEALTPGSLGAKTEGVSSFFCRPLFYHSHVCQRFWFISMAAKGKNSPSSDYLGFKLALIFGNDKGWLSLAFVEVAKLLIVPALWKPLPRIHSNSGSFACLADLKACARVLCDFINQPMESVRQFFSIGIIIGKWSCLLSEWIL